LKLPAKPRFGEVFAVSWVGCYNCFMNYELEIRKSNPAVFNNLTGALPPLVAGAGSASLITTPIITPFSAWTNGKERQSFSVEVWHLPTVNGLVIGHSDEGVFFEDGSYRLRLNFNDATFTEGIWPAPEVKSRHVVITYDSSRFSLYVDGINVISLDVPSLVTFEAASEPITTGTGIYDSLALYYRVLTPEDISIHYSWGHDAMSFITIASTKGASAFTLAFNDVDVYDAVVFDSTNWNQGLLTNITSTDPLTTTLTGATWDTMIPLGAFQDVTPGVYLSWAGRGVVVRYSLDGSAWTAATNRSTILEDVDLTDVVLYIRMELEVNGFVDNLKLYLLADRVMQPYSGTRLLTFKSASMDETPGHQLEYQADQGATIHGGYIQIEPDLTGAHAHSIRTIEMWAKSSTPITISAPVQTTYRNGVVSSTFDGQWAHYVFVLTAATNDPIKIANGQTLSVGTLAAYSDPLTASKISTLYSLNIGAAPIQMIDSGTIGVTESSPAFDVYAYTWAIVSG